MWLKEVAYKKAKAKKNPSHKFCSVMYFVTSNDKSCNAKTKAEEL